MTRSAILIATSILLACSALLAQDPPAPPVPAAATVADLVAIAREEAPNWLAAKGVKPPTPAPITRRVLPNAKAIRQLTAAMDRTHSADADQQLYVLYQLLQPALQFAATDLQPLLDRLTELETSAAYKPMLRLTQGEVLTLRQGAAQPNTETDRQARKIRRRKTAGERAIIKHNLLVRKLHATIARLRILAADPAADNRVLATLDADIKARRVTYTDALAAIWLAVTQIDAERAGSLYDRLKPLVKRTGGATVPLVDPGKLDSAPERNSRFVREPRCIGADVAKVVNVLATAAREPAVKVPRAPASPRRNRRGRRSRRNQPTQP